MTFRLPVSPLVAAALATAALGPMSLCAQRLSANVQPQHYRLAVAPDIAHATFSGSETIDITLAAPSTTVTLNALDLKIGTASARLADGSTLPAAVSYDPTREQATLTFARALPAGGSALQLSFTGVLNDKLRGFYLSKSGGRSYAVTQFESTDARRAFPCFDEPALKATFNVAVTADHAHMVLSNMNIVSDLPAAPVGTVQRHTVTFARTPRMSTYLVAFLIGEFACTSGAADGTPIRVCSTPDKVELTHFALNAAEHFLPYYNHYFGIRYPLPKLDLIGVPDFEAGAMENFGAITYRETELLVDAKDGSINARKRVSTVVAHEMAHQWFGDMVTMQWWDNLWLNEGFATWMENKAAAEWHPDWNFAQDVADDVSGTMNEDSLPSTRAIRASANTPAEIAQMFDGIAYGKAGAVIGMVEHWLGPAVFQQGVHNYLAAHLYGNATAEDFWNTQTATAHQPVDKVMSSFIDNPGVPLLTFRDPQRAGYPVRQRRFLLGGQTTDELAANDVSVGWTVPVCLKTNGAPVCQLLSRGSAALEAPPNASLPFLFANADAAGYYRVQYTPAQVKAITAAAETGLSLPERLAFLDERWALTRAGLSPVGDYLDFALALKHDPSAALLDSSLGTLGQIRAHVASDADRGAFNAMVRAEYSPINAALGPDPGPDAARGESLDRNDMRTELFTALGEAGDPAILAHARVLTADLFSGKKVTEPDLLDASVALTAETGDAAFWERLQIVSQRSKDPDLQTEALELLTRFRDPALVTRTLAYATSGEVRNQDSWIVIAREIAQRQTSSVAWPWVQAHWAQVSAQLTTSSGSNLVSATGSFCTVTDRDSVSSFFRSHQVEAADRALAKAIDSINACIALRHTEQPHLAAWLAAHASPTPAAIPNRVAATPAPNPVQATR